eukprot:7139598-Prymnesium_polylepis.1
MLVSIPTTTRFASGAPGPPGPSAKLARAGGCGCARGSTSRMPEETKKPPDTATMDIIANRTSSGAETCGSAGHAVYGDCMDGGWT